MKNKETATLGGGCFWCIEAVFQTLRGIENVVSGYAGGNTKHPTHREVGTGKTGHAEVVQITFDADEISFDVILRIFMASHDPTSLNCEGGNKGTPYRSIIFYENDSQKSIIESVFEELKVTFKKPIVTEVHACSTFYPAELNHQNYYLKNPEAGYCSMVINPKIKNIRKKYADKLKPF